LPQAGAAVVAFVDVPQLMGCPPPKHLHAVCAKASHKQLLRGKKPRL
jgi:hypothetical protein